MRRVLVPFTARFFVMSAEYGSVGVDRQLPRFPTGARASSAPEPVDLNAVIADIEPMLRRLIGEDIELRTELAPELGWVQADVGQLDQVILNLVVNARDALNGGGSIDVIMPGLDGRQLADRFAAVHPEAGVLFMSGYAGEALSAQGVLDSSVAFLAKPFVPAELARRVRALLDDPVG